MKKEESITYTIKDYTVVIKYGDKKLVDCMTNVIKLALVK